MNVNPAVPDCASVRIFPPAAPLATIVAGLSPGRIMLGTDNMPIERILERMDSFDFLNEAQRWAILYDNAARFLRLRIPTSGAL